jgi:hypothetical protein
MKISEQIAKDFLAAYKAGEKDKVAVLRMLKAAIKNREVEVGGELSDDEIRAILAKEKKQGRDAAEQFAAAGREDLAAREKAQLEIIQSYLPSMLTDPELTEAVDAVVQELGVTHIRDMGRVMKELMARYPERVDGNKAAQVVRSKLST